MDPTRIEDPDNWVGGLYELDVCLGASDNRRTDHAMKALWRLAAVEGCFTGDPPAPAACSIDSLKGTHHLHGVTRLPSGAACVCGMGLSRFDDEDRLFFYVPLAALAAIEPRVRGFPLSAESGAASLAWRTPIDDWLARIAALLYREVPYWQALIGFEPWTIFWGAGGIPEERGCDLVMPEGTELVRYKATF